MTSGNIKKALKELSPTSVGCFNHKMNNACQRALGISGTRKPEGLVAFLSNLNELHKAITGNKRSMSLFCKLQKALNETSRNGKTSSSTAILTIYCLMHSMLFKIRNAFETDKEK